MRVLRRQQVTDSRQDASPVLPSERPAVQTTRRGGRNGREQDTGWRTLTRRALRSHPTSSDTSPVRGHCKQRQDKMAVFVLDKHHQPLMPCSEKRARLLLARGRAVVHRRTPFTIRLKDRLVEASQLQPIALKLDPGSRTTGIALARIEASDDGAGTDDEVGNEVHHALHLAELEHRSERIYKAMYRRAAARRTRRGRKTRYRPARFLARARAKGWLGPCLRSRLDEIESQVRRYLQRCPV